MVPTTAEIRKFLTELFNDEDLEILCSDYFPTVYDQFTKGMAKGQKIQILLGYCRHREDFPRLQAELERERPEQYRQWFGARIAIPIAKPHRPARDLGQVFISHAHRDAEFAHRLAADLQVHGWRVWIAPDSIQPGERWAEAINRGLDESGIFIVALTPKAVESKWVTIETNAAIELGQKSLLTFVPLDVQTCDAPSLWRAYQFVSFQSSYEEGLAVLLAKMGNAQAIASPEAVTRWKTQVLRRAWGRFRLLPPFIKVGITAALLLLVMTILIRALDAPSLLGPRIASRSPTPKETVAFSQALSSSPTSSRSPTPKETVNLTPKPTIIPTVVLTAATTPTTERLVVSPKPLSSGTLRAPTPGLAKLSFLVPEGVSPQNTRIQDGATGKQLGSVDGNGPFWLPAGTYTVTLGVPFVGVSRGGVSLESGNETKLDGTQGIGRLTVQLPDTISLGSYDLSISERSTGSTSTAQVSGKGPFWLPVGTYTVTLPERFVGIGLGNVSIESGKDKILDPTEGTAKLSFLVPDGGSVNNTIIRDGTSGKKLGPYVQQGNGPFWLPAGTYTITLGMPFVGVSRGGVTLESGKETKLDITQGTGRLTIQLPDGLSWDNHGYTLSISERSTGSTSTESVWGNGPFWLPVGTYTVTLPSPFALVSPGNVSIESGKDKILDPTEGTAKLSFLVPDGVSVNNTMIRDGMSGRELGPVYGNGPFWFPAGTYTVTLGMPFIGVSRGGVILESGKETKLDLR